MPNTSNTMIWKIVSIALMVLLTLVGTLSAIVYNNLQAQVMMNTSDIRTLRECQIGNEKDLVHMRNDLTEIKAMVKEIAEKLSP